MLQPKEGIGRRPCAKCHGSAILIAPEATFARAALCDCAARCEICNDAGFLFERDDLGRETARMCACERRRVRVRLYNEASVPGKFADARLEDPFRDRYNHEAFSTCKLLVDQYSQGDRGIILMGPSGGGKTFLVAALIYEMIFTRGVPALFRDFFHLLANLRSGYSSGRPESELIEPLVSVEVLVVDELGKGRNTPWEQNILDVLISQRYNNRKTTIFTTNYTESRATTLPERVRSKDGPLGESELEIRETLRERVGPRIYSRLREMCDLVTLGGPDRRPQDGE